MSQVSGCSRGASCAELEHLKRQFPRRRRNRVAWLRSEGTGTQPSAQGQWPPAALWFLWTCYDIKHRRVTVPQGCHVTARSLNLFVVRLKVLTHGIRLRILGFL